MAAQALELAPLIPAFRILAYPPQAYSTVNTAQSMSRAGWGQIMETQTGHESESSAVIEASIGPCESEMLIEVDFKWLMAGQGRWIDPVRLHSDPCYALSCLSAASHSSCGALRLCAARLQDLLCAQHMGLLGIPQGANSQCGKWGASTQSSNAWGGSGSDSR